MNRDNDMNHLKSAKDLADRIGFQNGHPFGVYGDNVGGRSFTDEQSAQLEAQSSHVRSVGAGWYSVYAGPGTTKWTIIDCRPCTEDERAAYEEALASEAKS